jgi:hypothetical protein
MMLTCRQVSVIHAADGPGFQGIWGSRVRRGGPPTRPDFRIAVPARCWDAGKRNWEVGVWAPVYFYCRWCCDQLSARR